MKTLLLLLFAALCASASVSPCQTFNAVSGTINATTGEIDCSYILEPPSDEYQYVTIKFDWIMLDSLDLLSIYDGPSNGSALIAALPAGMRVTPAFATSQPYATIRFVSKTQWNGGGWSLQFQFHKGVAPLCAGKIMMCLFLHSRRS